MLCIIMCNCSNTTEYPFIEHFFHTCIYTQDDFISFIYGNIPAYLMWVIVTIPQIYKSFKTKRTTGLSLGFLLLWFFGDVCNLIGAILTHQISSLIIISFYWLLVDYILIFQKLHYSANDDNYASDDDEESNLIRNTDTNYGAVTDTHYGVVNVIHDKKKIPKK